MKPAIFNTEMVRAILDGRKTNTRRPFTFKKCIRDYVKSMGQDYCLKHQNKLHGEYDWSIRERSGVWADYTYQQFLDEYAPYKVGDIIYVRETFVVGIPDGTMKESESNPLTVFYKADNNVHGWLDEWENDVNVPWKPSIHMPKEYARLFLRVKDVRIERLNEIEYDDVLSEGFPIDNYEMKQTDKLYSADMHGEVDFEEDRAFEWFTEFWESIYGNSSFDNRYVWVIEFEQISKEEAMGETAT